MTTCWALGNPLALNLPLGSQPTSAFMHHQKRPSPTVLMLVKRWSWWQRWSLRGLQDQGTFARLPTPVRESGWKHLCQTSACLLRAAQCSRTAAPMHPIGRHRRRRRCSYRSGRGSMARGSASLAHGSGSRRDVQMGRSACIATRAPPGRSRRGGRPGKHVHAWSLLQAVPDKKASMIRAPKFAHAPWRKQGW